MGSQDYTSNVFINCPFEGYEEFLRTLVFVIYDCGFIPRCALEEDNSGDVRVRKIIRLIKSCKYGVHDISCTELDTVNNLPRFNMPYELGLFIGAREFGSQIHKSKNCLILDREKYRYQKYLSDLAGQDIRSHEGNTFELIKVVRNWLSTSSKRVGISGPNDIHKRYSQFTIQLPEICNSSKLNYDEMTYNDYSLFASEWLKDYWGISR